MDQYGEEIFAALTSIAGDIGTLISDIEKSIQNTHSRAAFSADIYRTLLDLLNIASAYRFYSLDRRVDRIIDGFQILAIRLNAGLTTYIDQHRELIRSGDSTI